MSNIYDPTPMGRARSYVATRPAPPARRTSCMVITAASYPQRCGKPSDGDQCPECRARLLKIRASRFSGVSRHETA